MSVVLPHGVTLKNGSFYWIHRNQWIGLGRTVDEAAPRFNNERRARGLPAAWPERRMYRELLQRARLNAKSRGLEFTIDEPYLQALITAGRHRCSLTGLKFDLDSRPGCSRRPFAPSIDRIESSGGYVEGNVRLVCFAINVALADWGEDIVHQWARAFLRTSKVAKKP